VRILNNVVRHFRTHGIYDATSTNGANLLIEDTTASDNVINGILVVPGAANFNATLNRITVNNNGAGVFSQQSISTTVANSVMFNNYAA
jgi:hypothetical protein